MIEAYRSQAEQGATPKQQLRLSEKEMLIIGGVTQGLKNKDIALEVGTTEQVVKNYLRKIYDKLGVSDRLELALYSMHRRLLDGYVPPSGRENLASQALSGASGESQKWRPPALLPGLTALRKNSKPPAILKLTAATSSVRRARFLSLPRRRCDADRGSYALQ